MPASFVPSSKTPRDGAPPTSPGTVESARQAVRSLLERSEAFAALPQDKRREFARGLVQIGTYLAEPDGVRLKQQSPRVQALANDSDGRIDVDPAKAPKFGQAVSTGIEQMAALVEQVNFPSFVSGLIQGVFHSIVDSSIQQMEAYAKLVADVSKTLNQFRDDNTTQNQGRDHLMEQFPDLFQLDVSEDAFASFGDSSAPAQPRVVLREDADEGQALERLNRTLPLEKPLTSLDDELVEALLVPAARTQLATGRQQLLATMVMMGINRIVVTDGKISAKVMFDFKASDNRRYALSRMDTDHQKDAWGTVQKIRVNDAPTGMIPKPDGTVERTYGSYYAKGDYKYSEQPIVKLVSTQKLMDDAQLSAKASLTGAVEVNFKSDYLPLDKMATPENIAAIQMYAQPGMVKTLAGRPAPPTPAAPLPPAATPAI